MDEDVDKLFSYYTRQELKIRDWHLGCTNKFFQFLILTYIVVEIFWRGKGYFTFEQARGAIATQVRGDAVAVSIGKPGTRYFSAEDLTYPGLENGNVFVATRQKVTRQRRGVCEDPTMPCATDAQCTASMGGTCSEKGFCMEPAWCPVEEVPEIYELESGDLFIWVKSSIQFVNLAANRIYSTEHDHPFPERGVNLFSVRDLLLMCLPAPVRYEEISKLGAAIEVQFIWNCDVNVAQCAPEVSARRLDILFDPHNIGYAFAYAERISEDERVLHEQQGVRIFLRTYGIARKAAVTHLITKVSIAYMLLKVATVVTDLLMLKIVRKRKKYYARKYEESPNFGELKFPNEQHLESHHDKKDPNEEQVQEREREWQRRLDED
mmetsp:Transcript_24139/g.56204  ORF Transcript_24139/g.56204 Transcript_24139/m.56204 type:complete len:379 (-) Transcript_24139:61-1197(-)